MIFPLPNKVNVIPKFVSLDFPRHPFFVRMAIGLSARMAALQLHGSARTVNVNQISVLRHGYACLDNSSLSQKQSRQGKAAVCSYASQLSSMHLAKHPPADLLDEAGKCRACQREKLRLHFPALLQKREKKQTTVPRFGCVHPIGNCGDRAKASRNGVRNPDARAQETKYGVRRALVEKKMESQP